MAARVPALTERNPLRILQAIRDLFAGRSQAAGAVVLTPGATETVVTAPTVNGDTAVVVQAASESAAGAPVYVAAVAKGTFTIAHDASAAADRRVFWIGLG